jgi:hypothetical protein
MKLRIFCCLLLLTSCASQRIKPDTEALLAKPAEGKAVIVTYRKSIKPTRLTVQNFISGQSLGELHNHQFNWSYVEPGIYTVTTRWEEAALIPTTERTLKVEAGQYYVLEMRGGVGVAVLFESREFKPTTTSLKTGDYTQALQWLDNCCERIRND